MQTNQYEYTEDLKYMYGDNHGHFIILWWEKWKAQLFISGQI